MANALTAELWECDTFQFIVWDTGSGDIHILFVKVNIRDTNHTRATAAIFDCEPIEIDELENSTLLMGLELTTHRLLIWFIMASNYLSNPKAAVQWKHLLFHAVFSEDRMQDLTIMYI